MNSYFAYIRVSTVKQGEHGSSLQEQRDAIQSFAARNHMRIAEWFEERETAAKIGRREFSRMVAALKKKKAVGVIFHKIDRSARNLRDWSAVQDLADQGIDVRFTQESVNLGSNEGKLTGDFLAVISAHYIRNLREEVKKGIHGRLKQGLYPGPAPFGYLNQGGGKPKIPDPARAPYVRQVFELYASGSYTLRGLSDELYKRGLRGRTGGKVGANRLSEILRNPFYVGVIKLKRSGECYPGVHTPLLTSALFAEVQGRLDGKLNAKAAVHDFTFRRTIECTNCRYHLIGERQKGHVYYRCHECVGRCVKEEVVQSAILARLAPLSLTDDEVVDLQQLVGTVTANWRNEREQLMQSLALQRTAVRSRITRLTDLLIDGAIEKALFQEKKLELLLEQQSLDEQHDRFSGNGDMAAQDIGQYIELVKTLPLSYGTANDVEKRQLLKTITSNLRLDQKNVLVELKSPFREIAALDIVLIGAPVRDRPRTRAKTIFDLLIKHFTAHTKEDQREDRPLAA